MVWFNLKLLVIKVKSGSVEQSWYLFRSRILHNAPL